MDCIRDKPDNKARIFVVNSKKTLFCSTSISVRVEYNAIGLL